MLDTRLVGRDKQLELATYFATGEFDIQAYAADIGDSARTLLGVNQREWLFNQFSNSATWQVLGQQVLMGTMELPTAIVTQQLSISEFAELAQLAQLAATTPELLTPEQQLLLADKAHLLQLGALPYNLDAWDGYPVERALLLNAAKAAGAELVVLAGDTHNAWHNQLSLNGDRVATELGVPSITSPGLETYLGLKDNLQVEQTEQGLVQLIENLQYTNLADRGYLVATFTPEYCDAEFIFVEGIGRQSYQVLTERNHSVRIAKTV